QKAPSPQSGDDADCGRTRHRAVTELFSGKDVGDVDLEDGFGKGPERVVEGIAGVGKTAGVDDDGVCLARPGLDLVDQRPLVVRLKESKLGLSLAGAVRRRLLGIRQ